MPAVTGLCIGMQIVCPNCTTAYEVSDAAIGAGRQVRCVRCREVWVAAPQPAMAEADEVAPRQAPPAAEQRKAEPAPNLEDEAAWGLAASPEPQPVSPEPELVSPEPQPVPSSPPAAIESPALAPADAEPPIADGPAGEETGAALTVPKRKRRTPPFRQTWPTVILSLLTLIGTILVWRAEVVRALPQTASLFSAIGLPVNLRGLVFTEVKTSKEVQDGVPVLVVEGAIANVTKARAEVPRLRLAIRDAAGLELYAWTALPPSPMLAGGEAQPFRTRLASPPAEGREVLVRFLNRRDR
jgi:predicted Zn finger-like uncharacterized protein